MSKTSDLGRNLRFNIVGLGAVGAEAFYLFLSNSAKYIQQTLIYLWFLVCSVWKFLSRNRYNLLDLAIATGIAFVGAFLTALFIFTISGVSMGWVNFLWLWLAYSLAVPVWFLLWTRKKT